MIKKKKNLFIKLGCLFSFLALILTFTFIGVKADTSDDYDTGYNNGYAQGVEDSFNNLSTYSVVLNYYSSANVFISHDNGTTYQNANSYVSVSKVASELVVTASNGFSTQANDIYYIDISLSSPCNVKDIKFYATNYPDLQRVEIATSSFGFTYTNIDNVGYIWSNQLLLKTNSIQIYFKGKANMSNSFRFLIDGYDTSMESYQNGYDKGVLDAESRLNTTISELRTNINILTQEVTTLQTQLSNNFGWQSLFFGMADTPFYTISNMLGFELFGINLFNALIGLITVLACFWLFKKLIH